MEIWKTPHGAFAEGDSIKSHRKEQSLHASYVNSVKGVEVAMSGAPMASF